MTTQQMTPEEYWKGHAKPKWVVSVIAMDRRGRQIDRHTRYIAASSQQAAEEVAAVLGVPGCASTAIRARARLMGPQDAYQSELF